MKDSQDICLGPTYSEAELKELAKFLGEPELSDELANKLRRVALSYHFMAGSDQSRATKSQRRAAFKRVEGAALELKEALDAVSSMIVDQVPKLPISDCHVLQRLAKEAGEAAAHVPPTGPNPEKARAVLVRQLAKIFKDVTGREPGRSATYKDGYYAGEGGDFYNFVVAALRPIGPDRLKGTKDVIEAVLQKVSPKS